MKHKLLLTALLVATFFSITNAQVPSYVPSNGLVAWFPFNGNANDLSGNGHNGIVNGATLTTDRFGNTGNAYNFNSSSYSNIGSNIGFQDTLTLSIWMKAGLPNTYYPRLFLYGASTTNIGNNIEVYTAGIMGNEPSWTSYIGDVYVETSLNNSAINNSFSSCDTNWHNLIFSFIPGNKIYVYTDGVLSAQKLMIGTPSFYNYQIFFGNSSTTNFGGCSQCGAFNGNLDDIAIWNRALTQQEITALYNAQPCTPQIVYIHDTLYQAPPCLPNYVPTNGLVGWWPFCGNANDESSNGNNGTVNGATLTTDRFGNAGKAYDFDGVNDFIQISNTTSLQTPNAISLNTWVKLNGVGHGRLISKGWSPEGIELHTENLANHKLRFGGSHNGIGYGPLSNTTLTDSIWYMITTIDNGNVKSIYVNGVFEDSLVHNLNLIPINSIDLMFGKNSQISSDYLNGQLDDIGIWNRALTQQEITALYTGSPCTQMVTLYDTITTHIQDTITTHITLHDTLTTHLYDTLTMHISINDTIPVYDSIHYAIYDTLTTQLYDTITTHITINDTITHYLAVTDTLLINAVLTGVPGPNNTNLIKVFPNPASDHLIINYGNYASMIGYSVKVTNALAQTVYSSVIVQQQVSIDLSTWSGKGTYILSIMNGSGAVIETRKIVLQ